MQGGAALKDTNIAPSTINLDGTGIRQLTPWGVHATEGDWSPDGRQIVVGTFEALRVEQSFNLTWSSDGTTIMFSHLELTADGQFVAGLQTISPDGGGQRWISQHDEHQADWGTARLK